MLTVRVVKIGGGELDDPGWLSRFASAAKAVEPVIVVHGGGRAISRALDASGLPVQMRDGIRVTTPQVATVVRQVLCGPVRTNVVGALRAAGVDAVGLAGLDGFLEVDLVDPVALGRVGRVTGVETQELRDLLAQGKTPVLAPVSRGEDGGIVNVNADDAASAVAGALGAAELLFISDVPGVLDRSGVLSSVNGEEVDQLICAGVVRDGMAAKLRAAGSAGATRVRIGNLELLRSVTAGTVVLRRGRSAA